MGDNRKTKPQPTKQTIDGLQYSVLVGDELNNPEFLGLIYKHKKNIAVDFKNVLCVAAGIQITGADYETIILTGHIKNNVKEIHLTESKLPDGKIIHFKEPIAVTFDNKANGGISKSDKSDVVITGDSARNLIVAIEKHTLEQIPNSQKALGKFLANKVSPPATVVKSDEFPSFPMINASAPELKIFASKPNGVTKQVPAKK